jgi:hypothetical protein
LSCRVFKIKMEGGRVVGIYNIEGPNKDFLNFEGHEGPVRVCMARGSYCHGSQCHWLYQMRAVALQAIASYYRQSLVSYCIRAVVSR